MANDGVKPEKPVENQKEAEKPIKKVKKKKVSEKERRLLTAINRLSKPTPNFQYMQNYYLPKPTARNFVKQQTIQDYATKKPIIIPEEKVYRLQEGVPERIIVNRQYFTQNLPELQHELLRKHTFKPDLNERSLKIATRVQTATKRTGVVLRNYQPMDGQRPPSIAPRKKSSVMHYRSGVFKLDPAVSARTSVDVSLIEKMKYRTYSKQFCDENDYISSPLKLFTQKTLGGTSTKDLIKQGISQANLSLKARPQSAYTGASTAGQTAATAFSRGTSAQTRNATHIIIGKKQSHMTLSSHAYNQKHTSSLSQTQNLPKPLQFGDGIDMPFTRNKKQLIKALEEEQDELKVECELLEETGIKIGLLNTNLKSIIGEKSVKIKDLNNIVSQEIEMKEQANE